MRSALTSATLAVIWLSWGVLLLVQALDAWTHQVPWIIWLGKLVPLLLFLPGMLRDKLRSFIWLCFICLMYFIVLVERLFAQPGSIIAITGMTAVVALFVASMMYVRWRARELHNSAEQASPSGEEL